MEYEEFRRRFELEHLSCQQEKAVKSLKKPTLLLSVPGSGKTTVVISRIGYMIYCASIQPSNILTVTFTAAAAREMKKRFVDKFHMDTKSGPYFSTIHSFCVGVIKRVQQSKGISIPNLEPNSESIIRQVLRELGCGYSQDSLVNTLARHIAKIKNSMLTSTEICSMNLTEIQIKETGRKTGDIKTISFFEFYQSYMKFMKNNHKMDFDDQLILAYNFLREYPDILKYYQIQFPYISVDEAQDTSLIQHRIVQLLTAETGSLFMVGDDDQSIYSFRGACPAALLNFSKDYQDAMILTMETNYRSDKSIVKAADAFIRRNKVRYQKEMKPFSAMEGKITQTLLSDIKEQYKYLLNRIAQHKSTERTLAVLYRNNESAVPAISLIEKTGKTVSCREGVNTFFTHSVVQDIIDFLNLSLNPKDIESYKRIYYKLGLYLTGKSFADVKQMVDDELFDSVFDALLARKTQEGAEIAQKNFDQKKWRQAENNIRKIKYIASVFKKMKTLATNSAIDLILDDLGYMKNVIEKMSKDNDNSYKSLLSKINTLRSIAQEFTSIPDFLEHITTLKNWSGNENSNIVFSTFHSSKGLEFDEVIIIDATEDVLSSESDEVEEETRLLYVGATRAKESLEVIAVKTIHGEKVKQSGLVESLLNG